MEPPETRDCCDTYPFQVHSTYCAESCEFGCNNPPGTYNANCPTHSPIDVEAHDVMLKIQEPIRAELRIANTTENLRKRVVATLNGNSGTTPFGHMNDTFG